MIYFNFVLFAPPLNNWVFINHQTFYIFSIDLIDSNPNHKFFWSISYIFLYILYSFSLFILTTDLRDRHYDFSLFVREKDTFSPNPVHTTLVDTQAGLMFQLALYLGRVTPDNGLNSSRRNVIWFTLLPALASKIPSLQYPWLSFYLHLLPNTENPLMDSKCLVGYWNFSPWIDSWKRIIPKTVSCAEIHIRK